MIKPISTYAYSLDSYEIIENQLIYCVDTREAYYDISNRNRIQIGCTIQIETEYEKNNLSHIQKNKIYIVKETNKLYRYLNGGFVNVIDKVSIIDILIPLDELVPVTINKQGINYAPKTLASMVYANDGNTVEDILKGMGSEDKKVLLYTRTEHVVATIDGQRVFGIPFPIPNYDLAKFPMLVIYKDRILSGKDYAISNDQVILNNTLDGLARDEILTFVFHYNVILTNDNLNAESINNVRFYVGDREPYPKMETDVWFDTEECSVKQYTNGKWRIIVKNGSGGSSNNTPFHITKNTTFLTTSSTYAEIGIPGFDSSKDILFVYENSVYLEENEDYNISSDGNYITNIGEHMWIGSEEDPVVLNFVVFKGINDKTSQIIKSTTVLSRDVSEIGISNFDKYSDTIMIYENSIYLEEGKDYIISDDSSKIISIKGDWKGSEEDVYLNSIIFKSSVNRPNIEEKIVDKDNILKTQIFNALGLTESEFEKLKQMIR